MTRPSASMTESVLSERIGLHRVVLWVEVEESLGPKPDFVRHIVAASLLLRSSEWSLKQSRS